MNEEVEEINELLGINPEEKLFLGFIILHSLILTKKRYRKISEQDLSIIYSGYASLLAQRKNYLETEKKLLSLNNFMGLR